MPVAWCFFPQQEGERAAGQAAALQTWQVAECRQEGIPCCLPALRDSKPWLSGEKQVYMPSPTCKLSAFAMHATEFVRQRFISIKAAFITGRAFRILNSTDSAVEESSWSQCEET